MGNHQSSHATGVKSGKVKAKYLNVYQQVESPLGATGQLFTDPCCWNVDLPSQFFTGRDSTLSLLHKTLEACSKESRWEDRIVVLYGLGGIGKSEIARKYAQLYCNGNDPVTKVVAWFNAVNIKELAEGFKEFAEDKLKLKIESEKNIPSHVYNFLAEKKIHSLFIFDNAQQMQHENNVGLFNFLPTMLQQHQLEYRPIILITSRHKKWDFAPCKILHVDRIVDPNEAVDVKMKPLELILPRELQEKEKIEISNLAGLLHGFPLALYLAFTKIRENLSICSALDTKSVGCI